MIQINEALERLARAKDGRQFKQMLAGLYTVNRQYPKTVQELRLIEEIWVIGRRNR